MKNVLLRLGYLAIVSTMLIATLRWWERPHVIPNLLTTPSHQPDAFITGVISTQFDKTGQIANRLKAPLLLHYNEDGRTEVHSPHIELPSQDHAPWYIEAAHGQSQGDHKVIDLQKNVHLTQPATEKTGERHIRTDVLHYWPNQHFAQTNKHVTVTEPGSVIQSKGARAYFQENRIQLLEKAQVVYKPEAMDQQIKT